MNFWMRIFGSARTTPGSDPFPIPFSEKKSGKKINFLFSCMHAISEEQEARQIFERWMVKYKTRYNDVSEKEKRFESFKRNMRRINKHNSDPHNTWTLALNQFADLSLQEFNAIYGNKCDEMEWRMLRYHINPDFGRRMHHDSGDAVDSRNHINPSKLWNRMFFGVFGSSGTGQWRLQSLPYCSSPGKQPGEPSAPNSKPHFRRFKALALLSSSVFLILYLRKKSLEEEEYLRKKQLEEEEVEAKWVLDPQMVIYREGDILPKSVDWREQGVLCPIKDQSDCGSCYAFASIAAIEALNKIRTGKLVALSEQQVLDCDQRSGGCLGGRSLPVYMFVMENGGIFTQKEYPYTGKFDLCCKERRRSLFSFRNNPVVTIDGFGFVASDELSLKKAVSIQPICASILPPLKEFSDYVGGLCIAPLELVDYSKIPQAKRPTPHSVLIIGYGTTADDQDYWILRNSYGKEWGEGGYMKVSCEIAKTWGITWSATYPIKFGGNRS